MIAVHGNYFKRRVLPCPPRPIIIPSLSNLPPKGYRSMGALMSQRAREIMIINDMSGHHT